MIFLYFELSLAFYWLVFRLTGQFGVRQLYKECLRRLNDTSCSARLPGQYCRTTSCFTFFTSEILRYLITLFLIAPTKTPFLLILPKDANVVMTGFPKAYSSYMGRFLKAPDVDSFSQIFFCYLQRLSETHSWLLLAKSVYTNSSWAWELENSRFRQNCYNY